jgi:hypothetical protein
MSYQTSYKLAAFNPEDLGAEDLGLWPEDTVLRVRQQLCPAYWASGPVPLDKDTGELFHGDRHTWYDHRFDLTLFSKLWPDWVWALYGRGEDMEDQWVLYAYQGNYYRVRMPPWEPPPPSLPRLKPAVKVPLTLTEVLAILSQGGHAEDCGAWNHPTGMDEGQCTCWMGVIRRELEATWVDREEARG